MESQVLVSENEVHFPLIGLMGLWIGEPNRFNKKGYEPSMNYNTINIYVGKRVKKCIKVKNKSFI